MKCFRYVDGFLICFSYDQFNAINVEEVLNLFHEARKGLEFTIELPDNDKLQFLDLCLLFSRHCTCWEYKTRSEKGLLPYESGHSKVVKRGIGTSCVGQAIKKSCDHKKDSALAMQVKKLLKCGYPKTLIVSVCEKVLSDICGRAKPDKENSKEYKKMAVIPYIHGVSHGLKKTGERNGVKVIFSAPYKLRGLCKKANDEQVSRKKFEVKHKYKYVECSNGVVYEIPLTCGKTYVGQTGQCLNKRLRQHENLVGKLTISGNLAAHCSNCKCTPCFKNTKKLAHVGNNRKKREVVEAFLMNEITGRDCVSAPSVALDSDTVKFLNHWFGTRQ